MKIKHIIWLVLLAVVVFLGFRSVSTYNKLSAYEQDVQLSWAQVETQFQRRYDLIPNLVNTIKGQANFESKTLEDIVKARASASSIKVSADDLTPEKLAQLQSEQNNLSTALGRLLMVTENYPTLKANEGFLNLQNQLEGIENRIAFARDDFNAKVRLYNAQLVTFPNNLYAKILGFKVKPYFTATAGAENAPTVDFGN
ncbi:LemA family protein [Psittacicella hinzii]|uniref:LemA family protein n=1 Tax=Psittacicella hinzii TaxID=2028575 RepID=A0A3A1YHC0_9GAMM|nr:LemA family protein [Psittacicella hinzii]RIY36460.1 LemA family protein [Psittacicella hinzii]